MPPLPFVKMHGAGNDFVVLDAIAQPLPANFNGPAAAIRLCHRKFGIGGDGLLLLSRGDNAPVRMTMWNPDGSEDMCGNGLRCIVALAHQRGHAPEIFSVETLAGLRGAAVLADGRVRVAMGEPSFELRDIPMTPTPGALPDGKPIEYALPVGEVVLPHVTTLSTGSTHTVVFGPLPDEATFQKLSPLIENHPWFPERTSVMWARVASRDTIELRIWERGAGETLACGTGACAAAVAAQLTGRAGTNVRVTSKGGPLEIEWKPGRQIHKTGPAEVVFEGKVVL